MGLPTWLLDAHQEHSVALVGMSKTYVAGEVNNWIGKDSRKRR